MYINLGGSTEVSQLDYHLGALSCVDCHGGNSTVPNSKEDAHTNLVSDPSEYDTEGKNKCSSSGCHESISGDYQNSLHQQLWGERKMVALRSGFDSFSECPTTTQEGFNGECTSCHATCGDCHISIPNSAGSGLVNSHKFKETPDQVNNCMACHGSRIAHDFLGDYEIYPARPRDVHAGMSFTCLNCHTKTEMHSPATEGTDRYQYDYLPTCEDAGCHTAADSLDEANAYHERHFDKLSCFVCHSQNYNNCTSCHVNHEWETDVDYQSKNPVEDFKIGLNPIKTEDGPLRFEFATLRHIPVDRESYLNWGTASTMPDYDDLPTWKYTSPHSILRFTARTDTTGGKACTESCHINDLGPSYPGNPDNAKYYLFKQFVEDDWPDEVNANLEVFVDGHLLPGWD